MAKQAEIMEAVLNVLIQILACQVCPFCNGTGIVARQPSFAENLAETFLGKRPNAAPPGGRCPCRDNAVRLIEELTGEPVERQA